MPPILTARRSRRRRAGRPILFKGLQIWGGGALDQTGWQPAVHLGAHVAVCALALTAFVVAQVGVIGFIGLAAPLLARLSGARRLRERPQDQFHVSTETQVDSLGSVRQMIGVTGPLNKDGTLRGRAVLVGSDGLESIDRTRSKEVMEYGALDYDITPRTTLSLSGGYQVSPVSGLDYGAGGVLNSDQTALIGRVPSSCTQNFSPSRNYSYTAIEEVNGNLVHRFENDWKSSTTLFYRHELSKSYYAYSGPGATADGLSYYGDQRQRNTYNWFGADTNVSGPIQIFGQIHTLTLGANYSVMSSTAQSGFVSLNGPYDDGAFSLFDPNAVPAVDVPFTFGTNERTVQYGLYAQARIHLAKPLTLVLGGREAFLQDRTQTTLPSVTGRSTDAQINQRFLPSAGLVWDIVPALTAYANYSRFLDAQTDTTYSGAALPPRTGEQYEVGLKSSLLGGSLNTTAALFRINDDNRAAWSKAGTRFSMLRSAIASTSTSRHRCS